MRPLEVCYLPAQWRTLDPAHLRDSACAVIDVIRATTTIALALENGARGVQPVAAVETAFALKAQQPEALLGGERGGQPLPGFDLGNSPREYPAGRVGGREIILTTTNGTQALAACTGARAIVAASFVNLAATAARLQELGPPWIIVCAGYEGHFGVDDAIVAGALAELLGHEHAFTHLYRSVRPELSEALLASSAGQELVKVGLQEDVALCAQHDLTAVVPTLDADGVLRPVRAGE